MHCVRGSIQSSLLYYAQGFFAVGCVALAAASLDFSSFCGALLWRLSLSMRNSLDFSSWQSLLSTLLGLLLATLLMLGIRLVFMQTLQRRVDGAAGHTAG